MLETEQIYHSSLLLLSKHDLSAFPYQPAAHRVTEVPSFLNEGRRTFPRGNERRAHNPRVREKSAEWWNAYGAAALAVREELDDLAHDLMIAARLHNRVVLEEESERGPGWRGGRGKRSSGGSVRWFSTEEDEEEGGKAARRELEKRLKGVVQIGYAGLRESRAGVATAR